MILICVVTKWKTIIAILFLKIKDLKGVVDWKMGHILKRHTVICVLLLESISSHNSNVILPCTTG